MTKEPFFENSKHRPGGLGIRVFLLVNGSESAADSAFQDGGAGTTIGNGLFMPRRLFQWPRRAEFVPLRAGIFRSPPRSRPRGSEIHFAPLFVRPCRPVPLWLRSCIIPPLSFTP